MVGQMGSIENEKNVSDVCASKARPEVDALDDQWFAPRRPASRPPPSAPAGRPSEAPPLGDDVADRWFR
jgi:hypothetical protein